MVCRGHARLLLFTVLLVAAALYVLLPVSRADVETLPDHPVLPDGESVNQSVPAIERPQSRRHLIPDSSDLHPLPPPQRPLAPQRTITPTILPLPRANQPHTSGDIEAPEPPVVTTNDLPATKQEVKDLAALLGGPPERSRAKEAGANAPGYFTADPANLCSWASKPHLPPDKSSEHAAKHVGLLRHVEDDWHQSRGILYALADGSFLGAWRHGGFIPQDTDVDIFLFLPVNTTRFAFREYVLPTLPRGWELRDISKTRHVGERTAHWYPPNRGRLQLVDVPRNATVDINVLTPEKLNNFFRPLCRCNFAPIVTLCFERAEKYLTLAYGAGFRRPKTLHTQRIDILNFNFRRPAS